MGLIERITFAAASLLGALANGCAPDLQRLDLRDFARPPTPNQYFAAPADFGRVAPDGPVPEFPLAPDALFQQARLVFGSQPRTREVMADPVARRLIFVQRSALFRFPDTVWIEIVAAPAGATLAIYSRSAYGYSDLGVNRARVKDWLAALSEAGRDRRQP